MLAENGTSELRKRGKTKPRSVPGGLGLGLSQTQVLCSQLRGGPRECGGIQVSKETATQSVLGWRHPEPASWWLSQDPVPHPDFSHHSPLVPGLAGKPGHGLQSCWIRA